MDAAEIITQAARNLQTLILTYVDAKGETTTREVEPYSWRPGNRFFAFDVSKGEIRGFRMDRVVAVEVTDSQFTPRWAVEI